MPLALPPSGPPPFASAKLLAPTALRSAPGGRVLERLGTRTRFELPRVLAVVGQKRGWLRVLVPELPNGESGWISGRRVLMYPVDWRVDVSLRRRETVVTRQGRVVQRLTVAIGRPSNPTPTGRFAVTDKIRFTAASPYGYGAIALTGHQPRVPQSWGGGDLLALHGTSAEATVGTAASLGCLRARRADITRLVRSVPLGTPVFIRL